MLLVLHQSKYTEIGQISFTVKSYNRESFSGWVIALIVFGVLLAIVVVGVIIKVWLKPLRVNSQYQEIRHEYSEEVKINQSDVYEESNLDTKSSKRNKYSLLSDEK